MKYQTILTIKESEKATVELAAVELFVGPVIVKRLKGGNPEIYRLLSGQNNPHIPQIYAVEEQENELFIAEEYVDGESLSEHLQKNLLSDEQKLNYALNPSVIHRDIKPSNILINGKGELKLIDFDASRHYKEAPSSSDTRLLGTVEYAPPEQFGYSQTDVRSDIYSMGVVFHEMRPTENKRLAEQWEKIAEKSTSFDPKNRYQSVAELKRELEKLVAWKKKRKTNLAGWIGGFVVLLAVTVLLAVLWPKEEKNEDVGGAKLTGVPTSAPTDAPTLTPTNAPTETPTPEPTATVTPSPTPTNTTTPEVEAERQKKIDEIVAELESEGLYIDTFYKELDTGSDFMQYSDWYEGDGFAFLEIWAHDLVTDNLFIIPKDCFYRKNSVLHIKSEYLRSWEAGCYRIYVTYEDKKIERAGTMTMHLQVFDGADVADEARILDNNSLEFYYEYYDCVHTIVANDILGGFKENGNYRLLENGRVIEFDKTILLQQINPGESGVLEFYLELDDGRTEKIKIMYLSGKPSYIK